MSDALDRVEAGIECMAGLITELESQEYRTGILPEMRVTLATLRQNVRRLRQPVGYPVADCEVTR